MLTDSMETRALFFRQLMH